MTPDANEPSQTDSPGDPKEGDLAAWYVPQLPMKAFHVPVKDLADGARILDVLSSFSLFEFENKVKPDYADVGGISRWEPDGDGGFCWGDVEDDDVIEAVEAAKAAGEWPT